MLCRLPRLTYEHDLGILPTELHRGPVNTWSIRLLCTHRFSSDRVGVRRHCCQFVFVEWNSCVVTCVSSVLPTPRQLSSHWFPFIFSSSRAIPCLFKWQCRYFWLVCLVPSPCFCYSILSNNTSAPTLTVFWNRLKTYLFFYRSFPS